MGFKSIKWIKYLDWENKSSEFRIIDDDFKWTGMGIGPTDRGGDAIITCYREKGLPVAENLAHYIQWCDKQKMGFPAEKVLRSLSKNPSFKPYENEVRKILFQPIDLPKPMTQIKDIQNPLGQQISTGIPSSDNPIILAMNGDKVLLGWKKTPSFGYFRPWSTSPEARKLRDDIQSKKYPVFNAKDIESYNAVRWVDSTTPCALINTPKQDTSVAEEAPTNTKTATNEFPLGSKVSVQGQPNVKDGVVIGKTSSLVTSSLVLVGQSSSPEWGWALKDDLRSRSVIDGDRKNNPNNFVPNVLDYKYAVWIDPKKLSPRDSLPEEINQAPTPTKTDKFKLGDRVSVPFPGYGDAFRKGTIIGKHRDARGELSYLIGSNTEKIGFPLKGNPSEKTIKGYITAHPENFLANTLTYQNAEWLMEDQLIIDNLPKSDEKVSLPTYDPAWLTGSKDDYKRKLDRAYKLATDLAMSGYGTEERVLDDIYNQKAIFIQKKAMPDKSSDAISRKVNEILAWDDLTYESVLHAWNGVKTSLKFVQESVDALNADRKKKDETEYKAKLNKAYKLAHEIERSGINKHEVGFENGSSINAMANRLMHVNDAAIFETEVRVKKWNVDQAKELAAKQEAEKQSSFGYVFKKETKEAGYRIAATQITKGIKTGLLALLKDRGTEEGKLKAISDLLDTDIGSALIAELLGHGLPHIPKVKDDARIVKLCEEFRISGYSTIGNSVVDQLLTYVLPAITGALSGLPSETENVRVATEEPRVEIDTPRVAELPELEQQEQLLVETLQNSL